TLTEPGPSPKLRGIRTSPTAGFVLKFPKGVQRIISEHAVPSGANEGRSVKRVSPFKSLPIVILNGRPVFRLMKGFKLTPQGARIVPLIKKRCLTSPPARPYSPLMSYGSAG